MAGSVDDRHLELRNQGIKIARAIETLERMKDARTEHMRAMHEAGISWAEIGRTFGVTPQAAMYATGAVKRTPRKKT